ncbi:biotin synthase [Aureococcus anophagefferens]|nr:biotin synthase [Aureococcus anophagefferens]
MYGSSRADSVRHQRRAMASMHRLGTALRAPGRRSLSSTTRDVPRKLSSASARVFEEPEADWATAPRPRSITVTKLLRDAAAVHRAHWDSRDVQQCTLLSIKTGGCTEDCGYCSQSVRHKTHVKPTRQLPVDDVLAAAKRAKAAGSSRFCMGAAWRELGNKKKAFREILEMVEKARQLKDAGLTAYNHNLDTSREFYPSVISTRTYDDRLATIANVQKAGISVCSGGILGLGEEEKDRAEPVDVFGMCRMIAAARIVLPKTMVRLSAGRLEFSKGEQALMFMAGANSIFNGDVLLTTPNPKFSEDAQLFDTLGLRGLKPKPTTTHLKREVDAPMAA